MRAVWKLTDAEGWTRRGQTGETLWLPCPVERRTGGGNTAMLCTAAYTHAYADPLLAEWLDPVHGNYGPTGLLLRCSAEEIVGDGLKLGCGWLRSDEVIERPVVSLAAKIRAAIMVAQIVTPVTETVWHEWARQWLSGEDRSAVAEVAEEAAEAARRATAWAAAAAAEAAAEAAAWAATPGVHSVDFLAIILEAVEAER